MSVEAENMIETADSMKYQNSSAGSRVNEESTEGNMEGDTDKDSLNQSVAADTDKLCKTYLKSEWAIAKNRVDVGKHYCVLVAGWAYTAAHMFTWEKHKVFGYYTDKKE